MNTADTPIAAKDEASGAPRLAALKALSFLMFFLFALTTDSVGSVIPAVIREFGLSMTAAGAFHYSTMAAMALSGFFLGFLADAMGHKRTILLGLAVFAVGSCLFLAGRSFVQFVVLLVISGAAIGLFRTGALALIGDLSTSNREHTRLMNTVEGFFGVGGILGPALVSLLLGSGASWRWLYAIAGFFCALLLLIAARERYPARTAAVREPVNLRATLRLLGNPWAMGFSAGLFLYVAVECAVYVWMPTLLQGYQGRLAWAVGSSLSVFFILRAAGRFAGSWMLGRLDWTAVTALFGLAIFGCFVGAVRGGPGAAVVLLPLSGLFMSVMYPTLNSKAMSCFPKSHHGSVAGLVLFFSCAAATAGPLAMGIASDRHGGPRSGFVLATVVAALLAAGLAANWLLQPARRRLGEMEAAERP